MRFVLLSIFIVALGLHCPLYAEELTGTLQQISQASKIKVGYRQDLPPMAFEGKDGQPLGYTIDICSQIVDEIEKTIGQEIAVEYIAVTSKDRFDALTSNKIDLLCGATTRTISRGKIVDFSQLTFVTGASFPTLAKTDISQGFEGKKIGVTDGSTTAMSLQNLLAETGVNAELVLMKSAEEGFQALNKEKIDAFSADQVVLIGLAMLSNRPQEYRVAPDLFTYEPFALAVRKNDSDFRLVADSVIADLYRTGKIFPIYDKWFGQFAKQRSSAFQALTQINAIPE